jgi:branched-chain amino acid transport system permease protein
MDYLFHIIVIACIYTILAVSLDLLMGQAGLLSVAHGALYGIGAYTSALLATQVGAPFLIGVVCGMSAGVAVSFVISIPSLRLRGEYFMIATFGFQMILLSTLSNWMDLTRGPLGISEIPRPMILGWTIQSNLGYAVLAAAFMTLAYLVVGCLSTGPFGRVLRTIREDEVFTQSLGKNVLRFKVTVFAISAALAGCAGSLYAHYFTYIDPTSFTIMESILVIAMVVLGGADSPWDPAIGAFVLVTLPEVLQFVGLPSAIAAQLRQVFYGALLVTMMIVRPRGLVGRYGFGR